ncbi:HEAT repeat domain-containing protein [Dyadobacter sp. NIV53]|uniref:HEAT repeat domain-containing protein n=1 Tax=Dyadobacter sp. NIV53 TaxID=2861765 RepID=UPI001C86AAEA|nr:HEAT repeat domain-containing protein [Dyadobacter sp. NIV53]
MAFYDLSKPERINAVANICSTILSELESGEYKSTFLYFSDDDTYIRKSAYLSVGRLYFTQALLQQKVINLLDAFLLHDDFKVRQTVINAAGEIGKSEFETVQHFFDKGLFDPHHSPRNAVIGSVKKMGEVNPKPVLSWAKKYLHHENKEIRREICHGIELRGRKFPQDILPLLKELQYDTTSLVRHTLVHVIGQIAYKDGCLSIVIEDLNHWDNQELVAAALEEIIDVHYRYRNFSALTQDEARQYISQNYRFKKKS